MLPAFTSWIGRLRQLKGMLMCASWMGQGAQSLVHLLDGVAETTEGHADVQPLDRRAEVAETKAMPLKVVASYPFTVVNWVSLPA